jgi:hypothetical protein
VQSATRLLNLMVSADVALCVAPSGLGWFLVFYRGDAPGCRKEPRWGWLLIGVDLAGRPFPAAAPTARIMAAWGIAPGVLATPSQALKGRNTVCRPFRARVVFGYLPGAMPQAVVRGPDGAGF